MPALRFPLDESKSKARVSFQALDIATLDVVVDFLRAKLEQARTVASDVQELVEERQNRDGSSTGNPFRITESEVDRLIPEAKAALAGAGNETLVGTGQRFTRIDPKIVLYLPQALEISDGVEVDTIDVGALGALAQRKINQGRQSEIMGDIRKGIGSVISSITSPGQAIKEAGGRLALRQALEKVNITGNERVSGFLGTQLRASLNPNARAAFQSVPLREFNFSFVMHPVSREEVDVIKQIIRFFRTELYPRSIDVGEGETAFSAGWDYPHVWEINQYYETDDKPLATRFLPAYLTAFSATYNNESQAFFEDGNFTDITINLSFLETSTLTSQQIEKGY